MHDPTDHGEDIPQGRVIYNRLIEEIRAGDLPPGSRLREVEIADRLGSSRTPVREAIRRLESDGLVAHVPRLGATIRTLDYPEIMELYEMRAVIEGIAFNHRHHVDALRDGFAPRAARLTGGISRAPVFAQLFADVLDMPVTVSATEEAAAWGAALCAGWEAHGAAAPGSRRLR